MSSPWTNSVYLVSSLGVKSLKCLEASVPNTSSTFLFIRANLKIKKKCRLQVIEQPSQNSGLSSLSDCFIFAREYHPHRNHPHTLPQFLLRSSKQSNAIYTYWPSLGQPQEKLPVWWSQVLHFHHCLERINKQPKCRKQN